MDTQEDVSLLIICMVPLFLYIMVFVIHIVLDLALLSPANSIVEILLGNRESVFEQIQNSTYVPHHYNAS